MLVQLRVCRKRRPVRAGGHTRGPSQLRTGLGAVWRPGELPGRRRGEERGGKKCPAPLPQGLQGGLNPDSGRKCELCPPCLCSGQAPQSTLGVCVCVSVTSHQITRLYVISYLAPVEIPLSIYINK